MSTSYDLSNQGAPRPPSGLPPQKQEAPRGTGTVLDDYVRVFTWITVIAFILSLGYLVWGLLGGAWTYPNYDLMGHPGRVKQLQNIDFFFRVLHITAILGLVGILYFAWRDESISYLLLTAAALFYFGFPYIFNYWISGTERKPSAATTEVLENLTQMVWIFLVPGVILVIFDIIRRIKETAENAAIQKTNVRYGANVVKQAPSSTQRQVFLGRCWELSYCRDNIRPKCPIFLEKKGPCWWRKRGCMCDERIVLQAVVANDWKEQTQKADEQHYRARGEVSYALTAGAAPILSEEAKRERCRNCVIYNEHQRQKYNALVGVVIAAYVGLLWLGQDFLQDQVLKLLRGVEAITKQLSFDNNGIPLGTNQPSAVVEWSILIILSMVALGIILRVVEWWCFTKKL
jgi:hypothetical protein